MNGTRARAGSEWRHLAVKETREKEQWLERDMKTSFRMEQTKVGMHADGSDTVESVEETGSRTAQRAKSFREENTVDEFIVDRKRATFFHFHERRQGRGEQGGVQM